MTLSDKIIEHDYSEFVDLGATEEDTRMPGLVELSMQIVDLPKLEDVLQKTVDLIVSHLNYCSAVVFLNKPSETRIYATTFTNSDANRLANTFLNRSFGSLYVEYKEENNLIVRSITNLKVIESPSLSDFISPVVGEQISNAMQSMIKAKNIIVIPIVSVNVCLGALLFAKQDESSFTADYKLLTMFSQQMGTVISKFSSEGEISQTPDDKASKIKNPFDSGVTQTP